MDDLSWLISLRKSLILESPLYIISNEIYLKRRINWIKLAVLRNVENPKISELQHDLLFI